jgi:hypothetical protein
MEEIELVSQIMANTGKGGTWMKLGKFEITDPTIMLGFLSEVIRSVFFFFFGSTRVWTQGLCNSICQFLLLFPGQLESYLENVARVCVFKCFPVVVSKFQILR